MTVKVIAYLVLVVVPGVPLTMLWRRLLAPNTPAFGTTRTGGWLVITETASLLWLLGGLAWRPLLGPDYSDRRFVVMYANLAVVVLSALAAVLVKHPERRLLVGCACALGLDWLYALVVSSAV
jgi:hypothetical protein